MNFGLPYKGSTLALTQTTRQVLAQSKRRKRDENRSVTRL